MTYVFLDIFRPDGLVAGVGRVQGAEDQSKQRINQCVSYGAGHHYGHQYGEYADVLQGESYGEFLQGFAGPHNGFSGQDAHQSWTAGHEDRLVQLVARVQQHVAKFTLAQ